MHEEHLSLWRHEHSFGQEKRKPGESRTLIVIALTGLMMVVEIAAGIAYGSMALLADGLHMASHTVALAINAFAYAYARQHAHDARFSFGVGKINTLGGYTGAVLLAGFALMMAGESLHRLVVPVDIAFNQAIAVAVLGLVVNGASVFILGIHNHDHGHHHHDHDHDHHEHDHDHHDHDHHDHGHHDHAHHHDHNLVSAYLHVLADALTSLLAIVALIFAKYFGATWMDPMMGIVGAVLVAKWSWGLLRATSDVLLDKQGPEPARKAIIDSIEACGDTRVVDIHLWSVGPNIASLMLSVVSKAPLAPDDYKKRLPAHLSLDHVTIEVHQYHEDRCQEAGHSH